MFKKKRAQKDAVKNQIAAEPTALFYQHPKILLIDTVPEIAATLKKEGYNVSSGTFGKPYKVQKGSGYQPVVVKVSLPNFTEQEIIVIDLVPDDPESGPPGEKMAPESEPDWWAKCSQGVIDPRPRAMAMVQDQFERILDSGGAFIIFSDSRDTQKLVLGRSYNRYNGLSIDQEINYDNWSFLSILSNLTINDDHGEEISAVKEEWSLVKLLADYVDEAKFCCTFEAQWHLEKRWGVLAKNKFGVAVSGVIVPPEKTKSGWIFIFPRIKNKDRFLSAFSRTSCPSYVRDCFPTQKDKSGCIGPSMNCRRFC
jgi:hypothetical protein